MRIHDILNAKGFTVIHVSPDSSVAEVVVLLKEHNLGAVVVSRDGKTMTGIISERDILRQLADGVEFLGGPVSSVMTTDVFSCSPDDTVESSMSAMTERRIRHLPVVNERHELSGIVSIGDLVKSQISELQFERDQLEGYVSG